MNAIINIDGSVQTHWVKMLISLKDWSDYFSDIGAYSILEKTDKAVLVAFRRVRCDEPLPHHLDECNDYETTKMEKRYESKLQF